MDFSVVGAIYGIPVPIPNRYPMTRHHTYGVVPFSGISVEELRSPLGWTPKPWSSESGSSSLNRFVSLKFTFSISFLSFYEPFGR